MFTFTLRSIQYKIIFYFNIFNYFIYLFYLFNYLFYWRLFLLNRNKTEIASARVEPWVKQIIADKGMSTREALEYLAWILASKTRLIKIEIQKTENEISVLELRYKKCLRELDEIQAETNIKESFLDELKQDLESIDDKDIEMADYLRPAIDSIFQTAISFNCHPCDVNKYTLTDTIEFQARKFKVTKSVLEEILKLEWNNKGEGD